MNKSLKLRMAAKLISCIGLIACLVGCAGYCILSLPEVMNLPFEWAYILIDVAVMLIFVIVGVLINMRANAIERAADMADEAAEAIDEENECDAECCATCPAADQCDYLVADDAAPQKEEVCEEAEEAEGNAPVVQYPAVVGKVREKLPAEVGEKVDKVVVVVKENKKTITAAAAACAAVLLVAQAGKARQAKRQAANRKKFYEWLG